MVTDNLDDALKEIFRWRSQPFSWSSLHKYILARGVIKGIYNKWLTQQKRFSEELNKENLALMALGKEVMELRAANFVLRKQVKGCLPSEAARYWMTAIERAKVYELLQLTKRHIGKGEKK